MSLPTRDFYGNRITDEIFRTEVGARAANCYDEAFAIEGRMIRAGLCTWRSARQTEWQTAARMEKDRRRRELDDTVQPLHAQAHRTRAGP